MRNYNINIETKLVQIFTIERSSLFCLKVGAVLHYHKNLLHKEIAFDHVTQDKLERDLALALLQL